MNVNNNQKELSIPFLAVKKDVSRYINTTPIAELEGLKSTDYVYSASGERWFIDDIDCEVITVNGDGIIPIDVDGVPYSIANQQLFWRTADRAERFGRGDV